MVQTPAKPETETLLLNLPKTLNLYVTLEQFTALAACNRELQLERTAKGELIVNPPTGWETGKRNWSISGELYLWWRNAGEPGEAFDSSTGFTLPNNANRSPDACWISQERWDALTDEQKDTFPHICPDFVVELRSASDKLKSLQEKMQEYLDNGARLGWLIDPQNRTVAVYRVGLEGEILSNPTELSGEEILPGFVLNLRRVWG
ncbi:Uma2 family endonuclease [Oscillatoria salina]|uniref:Uma2 family endonuclease n=1 Tax=Oscillatoria salina TaxID=331517 RepID=UPI0013B6B5CA|nr:Uma2 family endonuclease [Oscillatoria salina]MBZ8182610.1 Uma2 family endonuclease [Oscillatoria salina IIICB1]NET87422.1 Uma2 family endonuclease [Kamptonema sp. SIO1D9]